MWFAALQPHRKVLSDRRKIKILPEKSPIAFMPENGVIITFTPPYLDISGVFGDFLSDAKQSNLKTIKYLGKN